MKTGYLNEFEFINYLNKRKYIESNISIQELLKKLFPDIKEQDIICAYKYGSYAKADMVIEINGIKKGISIKSGSRNSVLLELIDSFINYLKRLGFVETDKLLRYLYSDGTNNNTGNIRLSSDEYKTNHKNDIDMINRDLKSLDHKLITRFLIATDTNYKVEVDAFIYGSVNDFLWATKEEVIEHLMKSNINSSGVHISNLFLQNWNKNLKYNPKYEYCRSYIQVKWYSIFDDFIEILCTRNQSHYK